MSRVPRSPGAARATAWRTSGCSRSGPRSRPARCGSPHFDLVVDAAQVFQLPVLAPAHPVAGAVEPPAAPSNGSPLPEALGAQGRTAQIAARQARAAQVQLAATWRARGSCRHRAPAPGARPWGPDGRIGLAEGRIGIGLPEHGRDHGLGGAVAVDPAGAASGAGARRRSLRAAWPRRRRSRARPRGSGPSAAPIRPVAADRPAESPHASRRGGPMASSVCSALQSSASRSSSEAPQHRAVKSRSCAPSNENDRKMQLARRGPIS